MPSTPPAAISHAALHQLEEGQEADVFALLAEKELLKTKEGKPYLRVTFRDAFREVRFPVWSDTALYKEFRELKSGTFCKLRAVFLMDRVYGPQLDIKRIRPVVESDAEDGFDPLLLRPKSPFSLDGMFDELQTLAAKHIGKGTLLNVVTKILKTHRASLMTCTAARQHHHCYIGGLLEHTLSVAKIALALVEHYHGMYPDRKAEISKPLVVAGAILHDVGKIREYEPEIGSMRHSTEGELIGHALLGRDIVRDAALDARLEPALQLRLEHIVISHQRYPDWGAAKPPMSLEAMIVHHADSCDALVGTMRHVFEQEQSDREITPKKTILGFPLLRPGVEINS